MKNSQVNIEFIKQSIKKKQGPNDQLATNLSQYLFFKKEQKVSCMIIVLHAIFSLHPITTYPRRQIFN